MPSIEERFERLEDEHYSRSIIAGGLLVRRISDGLETVSTHTYQREE